MKPLLNPVNNFEKSHMFSKSFLHKKPLTRIFEHKHSWFRHQSAYKHLKAGNSLFIRRRDSIPKMLLFAAGDTAQGRFISDMFLQQVNSSSVLWVLSPLVCVHTKTYIQITMHRRVGVVYKIVGLIIVDRETTLLQPCDKK